MWIRFMHFLKGQLLKVSDHVLIMCSATAFGSVMTFHTDLGSANTLPITKLQGTVQQNSKSNNNTEH